MDFVVSLSSGMAPLEDDLSESLSGEAFLPAGQVWRTYYYVTEWGYDSADQPKWMKYPGGSSGQSGEWVQNDYYSQLALDRLCTTTDGSNCTYPYVQNTDYEAAGRVEARTLGNNLIIDYKYFAWDVPNGQGRLEKVTTGTLQDLSYTYDPVGNVSRIFDAKANETLDFTYDNLNRLTGVSGAFVESYEYFTTDPGKNGNLKKKGATIYTYGAPGHAHAVSSLSSGWAYQYDSNGNQTVRTLSSSYYGLNLAYDSENRLTDASGDTVASYIYDGDGNRVSATVAGKTTIYIGNYYEEEIHAAVNVTNPGFETSTGWSAIPASAYPGTSLWRGNWGTAAAKSGTYAYSISNQAYGYLQSDLIANLSPNTQYDLYAWVRGELDAEDSGGGWHIRAYFYDSSGSYLSYQNSASGAAGTISTTWAQKGSRITTPASAASMRILLMNELGSGWIAFEDVELFKIVNGVRSGSNLAPNPGFETTGSWSEYHSSSFPGTAFFRSNATWSISAPHSGSYGYAISNLAFGDLHTDYIPVSPGAQYDLYTWVRGELDPEDSHSNYQIRAQFYDTANNPLTYLNSAQGEAGTLNLTWQYKGGRITAPSGSAKVKIFLIDQMNTGWVAFDDVELYLIVGSVRSGSNLIPDPGFESGTSWISSAYWPGTAFYRSTWGTATPRTGSYACVISNHANGSMQSDSIPASPNSPYSLYASLRGELDADDSEGAWSIRAYFYNSSQQYLSYADVGSGAPGSLDPTWRQRGGSFTTPANTAFIRIQLYNYMNSGWVAFDDVSLVQIAATPVVRKYYYAGGQRVAVRVGTGSGASGLSYLLGDHLGSTTVTVDAATGARTAELRYTPWGETRYELGSTPTTFRFTGQRQENGIGLYYYGARWYDPYITQFTQPDSIIPDLYNPLDWNRYSYARDNPIRYTDPTGHRVDDGCRTEGCSAVEGEDYRDYVYNVLHNEEERRENTKKVETAGKVIETGASILSEPIDWALTARDCLGGHCSPLALLGLLPLIPGSKIDDLVDAVKKMDGLEVPVDDALDLATQFLGKDYLDMGKGRFLSADGLRQVRMGDADILGTHPFAGGPHINFEVLAPNPANPGRFNIINNIHIFISEMIR